MTDSATPLRQLCAIRWPQRSDQELPERLATICHGKGIEVVEAMPKGADIDDAIELAQEAAPLVRLR